jgi:hypothetical protein
MVSSLGEQVQTDINHLTFPRFVRWGIIRSITSFRQVQFVPENNFLQVFALLCCFIRRFRTIACVKIEDMWLPFALSTLSIRLPRRMRMPNLVAECRAIPAYRFRKAHHQGIGRNGMTNGNFRKVRNGQLQGGQVMERQIVAGINAEP